MKKIIPFNNVLEFQTDVREITAISLEHEINKYPDMISGVFYITGEYKITDGQLEKEKFNFELPFDIALSSNYDLDSLLVDIDDFRYDIISNKNLKVNNDLYIDGEIIEKPLERNIYTEELPTKEENIIDLTDEILSSLRENTNDDLLSDLKDNTNKEEQLNETPKDQKEIEEPESIDEEETYEENEESNYDLIKESPERIDLLKDMLANDKEKDMDKDLNININNDNETENENINNNIFTEADEEQYVTYRVYKVTDSDTIDSILTKYNITKEELSNYNNIENITPGSKLIIPTNEK